MGFHIMKGVTNGKEDSKGDGGEDGEREGNRGVVVRFHVMNGGQTQRDMKV